MSFWCACPSMPTCEIRWCDRPAEMSVLVLASWKLPVHYGAKFFCLPCWNEVTAGWKTPIRGIDRPEQAPEDWRPSLDEMMRHARIAFDFENRHKKTTVPAPPPSGYLDSYWAKYEADRGLTPAQRQNMARHRELCRKYALTSTDRAAP